MTKKIDNTISENTVNAELEIIELDDTQLENAAGAGGDGDVSVNGIGNGIVLCDTNGLINLLGGCNEF